MNDLLKKIELTNIEQFSIDDELCRIRGNYIIVFDRFATELQNYDNVQSIGSYSTFNFCKKDPEFYFKLKKDGYVYSRERHCFLQGYAFGPHFSRKTKELAEIRTVVFIKAKRSGTKNYNIIEKSIKTTKTTPFNQKTDTRKIKGQLGSTLVQRISYEALLIDTNNLKVYGFKKFKPRLFNAIILPFFGVK